MKKHKILLGLESELVITKPGDRTGRSAHQHLREHRGWGEGWPQRGGGAPNQRCGQGGRAAATRASQGLRMRLGCGVDSAQVPQPGDPRPLPPKNR